MPAFGEEVETHSQTYGEKYLNQRSLSFPSYQSSGNPGETGAGGLYELESMEDTRRTWPTQSTKQGLHGLTETGAVIMRSAWVSTRFCVYTLWLLAWSFCGTLKALWLFTWCFVELLILGVGEPLTLLSPLGFFSSCWGCLVQFWWNGFFFALWYLVLLCLPIVP